MCEKERWAKGLEAMHLAKRRGSRKAQAGGAIVVRRRGRPKSAELTHGALDDGLRKGMTVRPVGGMRRKSGTPAAPSRIEERLALELAGREYCDSNGRPRFLPAAVREHRFHPERKWRFDFAWPQFRVAVECEGGEWTRGRHTRGTGFSKDCEKYNAAALSGWMVLRFTHSMVASGAAFEQIVAALLTKNSGLS